MNRTLRMLFISLASGCIFLNSDIQSFAGEIHRAVEKNDIEKVRSIISADHRALSEKNDDDPNNNLMLPIHIAASYDEPRIIELLVSNGADANSKNQRNETPLHLAAVCGSLNAAETLLKLSASVNAAGQNGSTPLHMVLNKPFEMGKLLIKYGADINARDNGRQTPLHNSAALGNSELAELLIKQGADAKAADQFNYNALHIIAMQPERTMSSGEIILVDTERNRADVNNIRLLLKAGLDINARVGDAAAGLSAMHLASRAGRLYVIEELINGKADINSVNKEGDTPLHYLLKDIPFVLPDMDRKEAEKEIQKFKDKQVSVFKFLIHKGADLNIENNSLDTVLDMAEFQNFEEIVKLLRDAGAKKGKSKNNNFAANSPEPVSVSPPPGNASPQKADHEFLSITTASAGTSVHDVLKTIAKQAHVNIILCGCVENNVNISLKDVFYEDAMKTVSKSGGLIMKKDGNIYIFSPEKPPAEGEIERSRKGRVISEEQSNSNGAQSEYVSLRTSGNCDIRSVIETVGNSAGLTIVLERQVEGTVNLQFKDIYYETALKIIAENNGLVMVRSGGVFKFGKK